MKILVQQIFWLFKILHRNNLILISIAVTLIYVGIFFLLRGLPNMEWLLTLLIYNDPAIIGMFFMGLGYLMERNQRILVALIVSPQDLHTYLLARIITFSLIGSLCALGMAFAVLGLEYHVLHFFIGVFATSALFCILGIGIAVYSSEFLLFLLRSIPVLILMSLPLIGYYQLFDSEIFEFFPIQGPLKLITASYESTSLEYSLIWDYLRSLGWLALAYALLYRFMKKTWARGL
ncbi:MAG: hypothetical protein AAGD28_13480 [Bacteroidota bacterium]